MTNVLVTDTKYEGKYVAIKSFSDKSIVAFGSTMDETVQKARQAGYEDAIVTFVPEEDSTFIY